MDTTDENLDRHRCLDQGPAKRPRACIHCHVRKVRCNAWQVGIPCTRCKRRNQASTCTFLQTTLGGMPRNSAKRQRPKHDSPTVDPSPAHGTGEHIFDESLLSSLPPSDTPPSQQEIVPAVHNVAPSETTQQDNQQVPSSRARTSPISNEQAESIGSVTDPTTREEDVHFRICEEMSRPRQAAVSPSPQSQNTDRHEVIELHEGVNPMTILGEALARQHPNRFVRVIVEDNSSKLCPRQYIAGFDYADTVYLESKGGLSLPPRPIRDELLRLYFSHIYPYAPILDRVKFMQDYTADQHSIFVLQSIFANVVPYAPEHLLRQAGYEDRITAQKQLYAKAALLYDMRYEKNQLYLLQGSIMLSSLSFSYAIDKDYRYWLTNAGRIATQMGLHRNYVSQNLGKRSKRLFRSIWWVLYNRDTLLTISGIDNLKRFDDRYCDTAPLEESDWEEEGEVPDEFRNILPPITRVQKAFMVEYSKLSIVSGLFIRDFKTPAKTPTPVEIEQLSTQITAWRKQLPLEIMHAFQDEWTSDNVLILVLLAMGYRLEAVFARAAKDHYRTRGDVACMQRMAQRQENAMFELSTMIQRASLNDVLHLCPLSFMTCASTILAMRIEIALDPATSPHKQRATKAQIFSELEYVRESCKYWNSLIWTVRMFEAVIARTRLDSVDTSPNGSTEAEEDTPASGHNVGVDRMDSSCRRTEQPPNDFFEGCRDMDSGALMTDDVFGILPVTDDYDWLEGLFGASRRDVTDVSGSF